MYLKIATYDFLYNQIIHYEKQQVIKCKYFTCSDSSTAAKNYTNYIQTVGGIKEGKIKIEKQILAFKQYVLNKTLMYESNNKIYLAMICIICISNPIFAMFKLLIVSHCFTVYIVANSFLRWFC
uniref:Uncharacterized protein n=1 Tax=Heterorhabditis bacteriophora TaxID=37862 RepID=A0A1I7W9I4_HETBA